VPDLLQQMKPLFDAITGSVEGRLEQDIVVAAEKE